MEYTLFRFANVITLRGRVNDETEGFTVKNLDFGPSSNCYVTQVRLVL